MILREGLWIALSAIKYRRILLKLSGEALGESVSDNLAVGLDFSKIHSVCEVIRQCHDLGVQIGLVLGGGHSIGVPLAVAAKRSLIAPSAAMTIHPVRLNGVVIGVPQTYNYFARIQERIVGFVIGHSNVSREKYMELMMTTDEIANDVGSVIYGEEAVACGLIDAIGTLSDALDYLHREIENNSK